MMTIADKLREEGIGIGVEKGIGIGVEKGIGIGVEKGEQNERLRMIRQMSENGLDFSTIAKITRLPLEEVTLALRSLASQSC